MLISGLVGGFRLSVRRLIVRVGLAVRIGVVFGLSFISDVSHERSLISLDAVVYDLLPAVGKDLPVRSFSIITIASLVLAEIVVVFVLNGVIVIVLGRVLH